MRIWAHAHIPTPGNAQPLLLLSRDSFDTAGFGRGGRVSVPFQMRLVDSRDEFKYDASAVSGVTIGRAIDKKRLLAEHFHAVGSGH